MFTLKTNLIIAGMFAFAIFTGCGPKEKKVLDEEITTDSASMEAKVKLDEILVNIPSPTEMSRELSKAGFTYNRGVLNSSGKASGYSTNYKAAANLGVYGADLGYTTAYDQSQDAIGYLAVIKQLSDKVGVGNAFDETLVKKFESNIGKKDSLEAFINMAYEKANRNLRSNQRVSTAAVIVAGGWIEGLYLASQVTASAVQSDKNIDVYKRIWNQLYSFKYVMELLGHYKNNADCAQMIKDLGDVDQLAKEFERNSTVVQADIAKISEKITPLRNQIVN